MKRRYFIRNGLLVPAAMVIAPKLFSGIPFPLVSSKKAASGGGCTTVKDSHTTAKDNTTNLFTTAGRQYFASFFVAGSSYTICGFELDVYKSGSPTMNVTPAIYSLNVNKPGTQLGTGTQVSASVLPAAAGTLYKFVGLSVALTNGTTYWLVLIADANSGSDFVKWDDVGDAAFPGYNEEQASADGTTWTNINNEQVRFNTYA